MFKKIKNFVKVTFFSESETDNLIPDFWLVLIISLMVIVGALPMLTGRLMVSHDTLSPIILMSQLYSYIGDGQIFVRWLPELSRGYGYPLFNFYSPLFYYLVYPLSWLGLGLISNLYIGTTILWFASGLGMYLWTREFFGKYGATVCATAYIFAPYHLVDIYIRGAIAESTAISFFPFVLWSLFKFNQTKNNRYIIISALGLGAVALAHNVMTIFFVPLAFVYIFFLYAIDQNRRIKTLLMNLSGWALGLGLSAFFWLSAMAEKGLVRTASMIEQYKYSDHFVYFDQFIISARGFGSSVLGRGDKMSFEIGAVHIILTIISLVSLKYIYRRSKLAAWHIGFFIIVAIASIYFATASSVFFWDNISLLQFAQFPWRFLAIIILATSFVCGGVFILIENEKIRLAMSAILVFLILVLNLPFSHPELYYNNVENVDTLSATLIRDPRVSSFSRYFADYTPLSVVEAPKSDPTEKLSVLSGESDIKYQHINSITHHFTVETKTTSRLRFNEFYFVGLKLIINGQNQDVDNINASGFLEFEVPPGHHEIIIKFTNSPIRRLAILISLASLFVLLAFIIYRQKIWDRKKMTIRNRMLLTGLLSLIIITLIYLSMQLIIMSHNRRGADFDSNTIDAVPEATIDYSVLGAYSSPWMASSSSSGDYQRHFDLGLKYGQEGDHYKAIKEFEKTVELNASYVPAYINLGNAYNNIHDIDKSIAAYEQVISLGAGDDNSVVYLNLASAYANTKKDYKKSIDLLEKYIALNPNDAQIISIRQQIAVLKNMIK